MPLEKMREFTEVFQHIKKLYVEEVSDDELMENAIRGMTSGLDPHSTYLKASDLKAFEESVSGEEYGGVGIYIGEKDGWVEIISPIDKSPAERAGLLAGDLIITIDGTSTKNMPIEKAVSMMRGKVGDILTLEVLTPPGDENNVPRKVELSREKIVAPSVVASLSEPDYGYLRINRFQRNTAEEAVNNLNRLREENKRSLKGLVLDLRNNPGGLLDVSVGIASIFLPKGVTVVSDRGRQQGDKTFVAQAKYYHNLQFIDEVKKMRIVVLVNNGSASASEIVAGALQDHHRAVIMGTPTYGKASVQSLLRLRSTQGKTGIKLTVARYFTPNNRSIQARGIEPDIEVSAGDSIKTKETFSVREANLLGHLENDQGSENTTATPAGEEEIAAPFIPDDDYQYDQALLILKALAIADGA
jgi:carboxyl-terminal processing protease